MSDTSKTHWHSFLNREVSAQEVVDKTCEAYSVRVRNALQWLDPQSPLRLTYTQMLTFCVDARSELIALAAAGANPEIVIRLANPPLTLLFDQRKQEPGESEFEAIKPPEYWQKKVKKLESAADDLAEFMKLGIYRAAEKGQFTPLELRLSPFARICKEVQTTKLALDRLVQAIRHEHLDSGARKLTYNSPYVFLETDMVDPDAPLVEEREEIPGHPLPYVSWQRTKPIGARGPKPDSPRQEDWHRPAYALWKYLLVRTGCSRVASVAHLIKCAGWDSPVKLGAEPSDLEVIRKRIEKQRSDPGIVLSWGDRITALEVDFECREHMDYGGFLTHTEAPLADEPERKK